MNTNENQIYPIIDPKQQALFHKLSNKLRCVVCPNQSIAESGAGLAVTLRNEIYQEVLANKTEEEIVFSMTTRHGESISYLPSFHSGTYFLWLGPIFLLLTSFLIIKKKISFTPQGQHQ